MLKHLFTYQIIAISILALSSCTFETDDFILTEVDRDISNIGIGFEGDLDTLQVFGNTQINFNYDFENREIIDVTTFLNDIELEDAVRFTSNGNYVEFNTREFEDGYYTLSIIFVVRSGSGSLADLAEVEFLTIGLSQIVFIDNIPVLPLQIVDRQIVDGALQIKWNKYKGFGFQYYSVGGCSHITNPNDTTATICNYAGGKYDIRLGVLAKQQFIESKTIYKDSLNVTIQETNDAVNITWDPTPYFRDFHYYEFGYTDNAISSKIETLQIRNINETSKTLQKSGFPSSFSVSGRLINSFFIEQQTLGDSFFDVSGYGTFLKNVKEVEADKLLAKFQNNGTFSTVALYNTVSGDKINMAEGTVDMSNNGQDVFQYLNGSINKLNRSTLDIQESYPISQNSQLGTEIRNLIALGNNKVLLHVRYDDNSLAIFIMNYSDKSIVRSGISQYLFFSGRISDDGRYLYSNNGLPRIGIQVYDLQEDQYADPDKNGTFINDAFFISSSNRLLKFNEASLYTTDLDGSNRENLNISQSEYNSFRSIDGANVLAYNENQNSDIAVFDTSNVSIVKVVAKYRNNMVYNIIDNMLIGFANRNMFIRKLE